MLRVVLDTNVIASAILWGGNPRLLLQAGRENRIELFTSVPMLVELADVLARPKFEKKIAAARMTPDQLVAGYSELAWVVRPVPTARIAPDPDDDVVIGTALAAKADYLITGDLAFLSVGEYEGIKITGVTEAIRLVSGR